MNFPVGGMLVFFALFWSAITLTFDGVLVRTAFLQLRANGYTVTDGTIIASSIARSEDGDGTTYKPEVSFRYRVGEHEFTSDRLAYGTMFTSGRGWAERTVAELTPGTAVRVYYNPAAPADSLLRLGIDSSQLFLALFLTPFNAVMVFLWAALAQATRHKWFPPPAGGVRIDSGARGTSIRLDGPPALGAGLGAMALVAFVGIFAVALFGGFHPPLPVVSIMWIVVLASGVAATLWQFARNRSDRARLILDEGNSTIVLPPLHGRTERVVLPLSDLTGLRLSRELTRDSDGDAHTKYALALAAKGRAPERLALWSSEPQTRGFATWLAARLRVPLAEE